ncbi:MAG: hypothetical protein ACOVN9_00415, partial [Inhella sp.]
GELNGTGRRAGRGWGGKRLGAHRRPSHKPRWGGLLRQGKRGDSVLPEGREHTARELLDHAAHGSVGVGLVAAGT